MNSFLSLLDYLYTDCLSSDLTTTEYKDLLVLADRFCLARLITVCEVAIRKKIGKELKTKRLNSAKCAEVIDLLLLAQVRDVKPLNQKIINSKLLFEMLLNYLHFLKKGIDYLLKESVCDIYYFCFFISMF